jgi:hypothetical protein
MNVTEAHCSAIWCAANWAVPSSPITKPAAANSPTSMTRVKPIGSPMRTISRRRAQSGRHNRPRM